MMVLASVYLSVSASLPSTSVIKPVEIWLLFNLAYPFLVILVNVLLQVAIIDINYDLIFYQTYADVTETRKEGKQQEIF